MLNLFNRSPWERPSVVSLQGSLLAQARESCEMTPEGGLRCADGTYLPPGCEEGSPQVVKGQPLVQDFPVVPVALAIAGVSVASAIFLSGRRMGALAELPADAVDRLQELSNSIKAERAADAWNHQQYLAKRKADADLLSKESQAEAALAQENKRWEETHRNPSELQAAQDNLNTIVAQRAQLKAEAEDFRGRVDQNAQNVLSFRQQAMNIITTLPEEYQAEARRMIDPCYQVAALQGPLYPVINR